MLSSESEPHFGGLRAVPRLAETILRAEDFNWLLNLVTRHESWTIQTFLFDRPFIALSSYIVACCVE
jgi:hypothetical protein